VLLPRGRRASTKRRKDAGSLASGASGATEDAAPRSVIARRTSGGQCLGEHYV